MKISQGLKVVLSKKAHKAITDSSYKDKTFKEMYKIMRTPEFREEVLDSDLRDMKIKEIYKDDKAVKDFLIKNDLKKYDNVVLKDFLATTSCKEFRTDL